MIGRFIKYLEDVAVELKKVVWPSKDNLINSTIVVIILSLIFSIFIYFVDQIFSRIVGFLLRGS
jgi:preprotein translocase subunit SecE